jgi:hypothetical protein
MKIKLLVLLILFLLLEGCSPLENPGEQGTPVPPTPTLEQGTPVPPTPTLEPATNFEKGISQVPKGYYIFIELRNREECSSECQCAPAPVRMLYDIDSSGVLWTDLFNLNEALTKPIVGFFGFGNWRDQLYVIDSLPYKVPPYDAATVYSIDDKGVAIMEYFGKTFYIKPGQSWTNEGNEKREPPAGCSIDYGTTLTNHGLLSRAEIQLGDPYNHK